VIWLLLHLVATAVLAGVGWVVQAVVYPAFALVGPAEWPAYHRQHVRRIGWVVGPPWLVQGVSAAALLLAAPWEFAALGGLAAAGVALTVCAAVPAHGGLHADRDLSRLLRANLLRSAVWTIATVVAAAQLAAGLPLRP